MLTLRRRALPLYFAGACLAGAAAAQTVALKSENGTLREVLNALSRSTGYEFTLAVDRNKEQERRGVDLTGVSTPEAVSRVAALFGCDFFSASPGGFIVVEAPKLTGNELAVGPYRLRVAGPNRVPEGDDLELALVFTAPDETAVETIAGLDKDLRIVDSFSRSLLPPSAAPVRTTGAARVRLTEYRHRLHLPAPHPNSTRIRSIRGSLILYEKVTPLRFEFPVGASETRELVQENVRFALERTSLLGRDALISTRLTWADGRAVIGRGISRTPLPYLVDEKGRVYRDGAPNLSQSRTREGERVLEQRFRFEGLEAPPATLVYEVFLKEQPTMRLPFRVTDLPLPPAFTGGAPVPQRPFYAAGGGSISLAVTDREGKPVEGALSLGLSRKTGAAWSGWRWLELVTDGEGRAGLEHLQPGTYRVQRVFRLDPSRAPVNPPERPMEIVVAAGKELALPVLKLPILAPEEL
jgi:hypothetical protein